MLVICRVSHHSKVQHNRMASDVLDLFVVGIQKIIAQHYQTKEPDTSKCKVKHSRGCQASGRFTQPKKSKKGGPFKQRKKCLTEYPWDTESNSSISSNQVTNQPVIWVDIVKKIAAPEITKRDEKLQPRKTPTFFSPYNVRRGLLPDGFKSFLLNKLSLIAEVQTAKKRRLDNRQIFRPQEDNINWTSNAPRPSEWLLKPRPPHKKIGKVRVKSKTRLELPDGLQGIPLPGREPRITNVRQPRSGNKKTTIKKKWHSSYAKPLQNPLNVGQLPKKVTFQLPNKTMTAGKKKKKRRRTRKKAKVFAIH